MMLVQLFSSVRSFRMTLKGYANLEAQMTYAERVFEFVDEDPVMFTGTIRDNLDPFQDRSESELMDALKTVRLEDWVRSVGGSEKGEDGLQGLVSEAGGNMSVGQRQLICLARALLKRPHILVLDEATASVDYDTDRLIQKAIRTEFDCTVLTIAHRLHTILDSDRIIVLSSGKLIENGRPEDLLAQEGGVFKDMVATTE